MDDLACFPFFRPFAPQALEVLAGVARWQDFEPGQAVLEPGDPAAEVIFIAEGELRIVMRSPGGHEIILNDLGPGQFFGEVAAIDSGPRSAGLVALTRARVCAIPAAPFLAFALSAPEASHQVMRMLTALVREKDARLTELTILPVRSRLIAQLLRLAKPHQGGGMIVAPPRPHHELAARVGTRREVVTRILGALTREGLAEPGQGGLVLPDPKTLIGEVETSYRIAAGG